MVKIHYRGCWSGLSHFFIPDSSLLCMHALRSPGDDLGTWVPLACTKGLHWIPAFLLYPGLSLAVTGIWQVNQQTDLFVSLPQSLILIFLNK